ncbi:MAG: hypothetical protein A2539_02670 [Elusimicrobia bacterium RIFOXYD2_FULL_34_15]|nr:MAG: hypothetical protein A2539_02670 [Elusimicrobia bacterium RIFOXYD2_FULL_34_15]
MSKILKDDSIFDIGNAMRMKRNADLYEGGIIISEKESKDYCRYAEKVIERVEFLMLEKMKES